MCANQRSVRDRVTPDMSEIVKLTARDGELISHVALHGAVTCKQLVHLGLFGSTSRANRRLRSLFDGHYLRRTFLAGGPYGAEAVYLLGPAGCPIVVRETGLDVEDVARWSTRQPVRTYLEHHLATMSVRLAIRCDAARMGISIKTYLAEALCRHEYTVGSHGRESRRIIKPDGFFHAEFQGVDLAVFLEVDRGCVSSKQLSRTFSRYRSYLTDGAFGDCYEQPNFQVLLITTAGPRRIENLKRLTKSDLEPLIRFTTMEAVEQHGFFGPIWGRCGVAQCETLFFDRSPEVV